MALIKCPECGKEISDKALACPNCGCPITASTQKSIPISFIRAKKFINSGVQGQIMIDNVAVGLCYNGGTVNTTITPGKHSIVINSSTGNINAFGDIVSHSERAEGHDITVPENATRIDCTVEPKSHFSTVGLVITDVRIKS